MRVIKTLLAVTLLVSCAARADEPGTDTHPHFAVSAGLGLSQDFYGLGLELRAGHFGAAVGVGAPLLLGAVFACCGGVHSALGSLRYFKDGWFYALNGGLVIDFDDAFTLVDWQRSSDLPTPKTYLHLWAVSITAVRRFQSGHWFWQAGGGPAVYFTDRGGEKHWYPLVDIQAAVGYEF